MLKWAQDNLYIRSSDEWSYDTLKADPLVHLLIGACASEAQEVYESIQTSDDRLLKRLLNYILPNSFHQPQPAVGIAKAQARTSTCSLPTTHRLIYQNGSKKLTFTPLFDTKLINGNIRFIGTDSQIIEYNHEPHYFLNNDTQYVSRLLIGLEVQNKIDSLENIAFYIDWKGNELEKRQLLLALSQSQWTINGQTLTQQNGFLNPQEIHWQDHFNPEKKLMQSINAQYKQHFHLITTPHQISDEKIGVQEALQNWLRKNPLISNPTDTVSKWDAVKGNFIWLTIQLPYRITLTDIECHLIFATNHFIVVNRALEKKDDNDTYFSRSLGLEVLKIDAKNGLFYNIKSVNNKINNQSIPHLSFSQLIRHKNEAAYSFRIGGVGRMDSYNVWQRLSYMFTLFHKEHRLYQIIEELSDKMSLDELHEVIKHIFEKNLKQTVPETPQPPIYLFVRPGEQQAQLKIKVSYWTTDGEAANHLPPDSNLISEPLVAGLNSSSIQLVSSTNGGKNRHSTTEQLQVLQDTLYRQGRIVSKHDIKSLCHQKIGKNLKQVSIHNYFETTQTANNVGIQRAIEVRLKVAESALPYVYQQAQEIEFILQENSVGSMPYRVTVIED